MNEHDPWDPDHANLDHWDMYAEAMDLTIEGHRLIAQEIAFEVKLLWRAAVSRLRGMAGMVPRRRSIPPV
jgi:hypothetical protein